MGSSSPLFTKVNTIPFAEELKLSFSPFYANTTFLSMRTVHQPVDSSPTRSQRAAHPASKVDGTSNLDLALSIEATISTTLSSPLRRWSKATPPSTASLATLLH